MDSDLYAGIAGLGLFAAVFVGALALLGACAFASGKHDFCYVQGAGEPVLYAHVPWRPDRPIQRLKEAGEGVELAEKLGCPLK